VTDSQGPSSNDPRAKSDRGATAGTPRWVRVSAIVVAVLLLLMIVVLLVGGGQHGPSRHAARDHIGVRDAPAAASPTDPARSGRIGTSR
jgi:hypothetical protein